MKFISFNINGLRARPHQLAAIVDKHQPDVIGLRNQSTRRYVSSRRGGKAGLQRLLPWAKGHYGVALLTKETPIAVRRGFPGDGEDAQRRIIMAEIPSPFGNVTVINGYFPQGESRDHETKFPAKAAFYQNLQNYLDTELNKENPVLIMGDMNISPTDLDIGIGEENRKRWLRTGKCSFLPEEREWMDRLLGWGLVDTGVTPTRIIMTASHGSITALKVSMTIAVCVSTCCWQARRWLSAASKPASITTSAGWKSLPIMRRYGQPLNHNSSLGLRRGARYRAKSIK